MSALLDTSKLIVGVPGSGKTVTAKADVQQLLDEGRQVVVIDPTGVWWGMRSNAAGDGAGFDIPIFGGEHGDVPIRPVDGAAIARIIVEQRVSAIVDVSGIDNSADWRLFMHDLVAELRRKPKGNFHLVIDEADEFAAERVADQIGFALRENLVWMAKRGRVRGFVPMFITQRTAEIAKAVISPVQTIVAHQLLAPTDQKAIDDYLKNHAQPAVRKEVMGSLAELEVGERWIYSPRLQILERGRTPPLLTFDSSRTPAPGERLEAPRTLAELDVTAIRAALSTGKPEALKSGPPDDESLPNGRVAELEAANALLEETARELAGQRDALQAGLKSIRDLVDQALKSAPIDNPLSADAISKVVPRPALDVPAAIAAAKSKRGLEIRIATPRPSATDLGRLNKTAVEAAGLLLVVFSKGLAWNEILLLLGRRPNSGDTRLARKGLNEHGLIEERDGKCFASTALLARTDVNVGRWPGPDELINLWADKLRGPSGEMLRNLAMFGPATNAELAARLGKSATSGWWRQGIKDLRGSGVTEIVDGELQLHPLLRGNVADRPLPWRLAGSNE